MPKSLQVTSPLRCWPRNVWQGYFRTLRWTTGNSWKCRRKRAARMSWRLLELQSWRRHWKVWLGLLVSWRDTCRRSHVCSCETDFVREIITFYNVFYVKLWYCVSKWNVLSEKRHLKMFNKAVWKEDSLENSNYRHTSKTKNVVRITNSSIYIYI